MSKNILVAVFSASGVTKAVGKEIARISDADFFEIVPKEIYTTDDLNWMNKKSRSSVEMNDPSARPEIADTVSDMASYDKVIVGFPIWWGGLRPESLILSLKATTLLGKLLFPSAHQAAAVSAGAIRLCTKMYTAT